MGRNRDGPARGSSDGPPEGMDLRVSQQSDGFLARGLDATPIPLVVLDATTCRIVDCNDAAVRAFRFPSKGATLGVALLDVSAEVQYDGSRSEDKLRHYVDVAQSEGPVSFEWHYRRFDGTTRDGEVHLQAFESGGRRLIQSVLYDITQRRRAETALYERELHYRQLFESNPAPMVIYERGTLRLLAVNESFERHYGYSRAEAAELSFLDLFLPEERARVPQLLASGQDRSQLDEWHHVTRDGTPIAVVGVSHCLSIGGHEGCAVVLTDITERMRVQQALQDSEERYRQIALCVPDLIWTADLSGRFTYASSAVLRTHGYTADEFLNLTFEDVTAPEHLERYRRVLARELLRAKDRTYRQQEPLVIDSSELRKDGSPFPVELSVAFLRSESGAPAGIVGVTRDITERTRIDSERRQLEHQLYQAQKMEAVGQLAGGIAHDFNNILTAIMVELDLLQGGPVSPEDLACGLEDLKREASRASELTRQLLMFSRRQKLKPAVFELNSLITNLLKMLGRLISESIHLEFRPCASELWLLADSGLIEQVVVNLVVNARDAMPNGGRLTLTTDNTGLSSSSSHRSPEARSGQFVRLAVSDSGCGMSPETLKHIFEPFFTTKQPGKGTGLGLAMVYGIVNQHHGWMEVTSVLGQGSTFEIFLPTPAEQPPASASPASCRGVKGGSETLLLVEDEETLRHRLREVLTRLGYKVHEARDGIDALEQWPELGPHVALLVTDIVMPRGLSGIELARRLRELNPSLRVLLMSGYNPTEAQQGRAELRLLEKPFTTAVFAATIRECLDLPL